MSVGGPQPDIAHDPRADALDRLTGQFMRTAQRLPTLFDGRIKQVDRAGPCEFCGRALPNHTPQLYRFHKAWGRLQIAFLHDPQYQAAPTYFDRPITEYGGFHKQVARLRGRPKRCEDCGATDPTKRYEWANLTGNFSDPSDYKRLCVRCHRRFDRIAEKVALRLRGRARLDMQGEKHHQAKLTEEQVRDIRSRHYNETRPKGYAEVAREFSVSEPTIKRIVLLRTWGHVFA